MTGAVLSYLESGDKNGTDSNFRGFSRALNVGYSMDYSSYIAVGMPNGTSFSLAKSIDGRSWNGIAGSSSSCPVGTSVVYGRGRWLVGCAGGVTINLSVFPGPKFSASAADKMQISINNGASFSAVSAPMFAYVSRIVYSDLLLLFVAIGVCF